MPDDQERCPHERERELKISLEDNVPWWVKVFGSVLVLILFSVVAGMFQHLFAQVHEQSHLLRDLQAKASAIAEKVDRLDKEACSQRDLVSKLGERLAGVERSAKAEAVPAPGDLPLLADPPAPGAVELAVYSEDWCPPCRLLKARTLRDPKVKAALARLGVAGVRVLPPRQASPRVSSIPTCRLVKDGDPVGASDLVGFVGPDEFVRWLEEALTPP